MVCSSVITPGFYRCECLDLLNVFCVECGNIAKNKLRFIDEYRQ